MLKPEREWTQHDWSKTLIPAAIKAGMPNSCLRVCTALCARQRGRDWYPHVIVSLDELSQLAGWKPRFSQRSGRLEPDHGSLNRAIRRLEKAGLLVVDAGFGSVPNKRTRKASAYRPGPAVRGAELPPLRGAELPPLNGRAPDHVRGEIAPPRPYLSPTEREGNQGERTAALTGGPTTISPLQPLSTHRFRDLLEKFRPTNHGLA